MKKFKWFAVLVACILFIIAGFLIYEYGTVCDLNRHIDVSGVKFLMEDNKVEETLNSIGKPTKGFGISGYFFEKEQLEVEFIYHGLFAHKATAITSSNPAHNIYGIHIGDSYKSAVYKLNINGFRTESYGSDRFIKKFICVTLNPVINDTNIRKVRVEINSWTPFKVIY